jgi:hypothetical protein
MKHKILCYCQVYHKYHILLSFYTCILQQGCDFIMILCILGHMVARLFEALCYKREGRGFDSRCSQWNFSLTFSFWPCYGPGVDSASNRNEYQEYILGDKCGQCVGLTTLPHLCADFLEISEPQPPGSLRPFPGL